EVPAWMSRAEYEAMPATLSLREIRLQVRDKSKRIRNVVLVTTLLDAKVYPAAEIRALYRQRWHAELDLRSLKTVMRMEVLRGQSPEMVRKEVAVHLLLPFGRTILAGRGSLAPVPRVTWYRGSHRR